MGFGAANIQSQKERLMKMVGIPALQVFLFIACDRDYIAVLYHLYGSID